MPKLAILVIDADNEPIYELGRELWRLNAAKHGIPIYFLRSSPAVGENEVQVDGDCLYAKWFGSETDIFDGINERILYKTLMGLHYCYGNLPFDYVLRTNLSSFYRLDATLAFLATQPSEKYYAGPLNRLTIDVLEGGTHELDYISGSGILLSRDMVEQILKTRFRLHEGNVDDIWIALAMHKIPRTPLPRCDFEDVTAFDAATFRRISERLSASVASGVFHYRVKNGGYRPRQVADSLVFGLLADRFLFAPEKS